ncbi:hypothetical protein CEXT_9641 [Caerostris extrusa]|uniref:Uncharacterized protein n=1 Tax=Caerostris extrusa TaxID=172846 RepID=A0AAV4YDW0_CAEEX|nr:hypothetical protein CEXT_9641 [Caerostris extrusa]
MPVNYLITWQISQSKPFIRQLVDVMPIFEMYHGPLAHPIFLLQISPNISVPQSAKKEENHSTTTLLPFSDWSMPGPHIAGRNHQ